MTEYDYSPGALDRQAARMAGVERWATKQDRFAPSYTSPFDSVPDLLGPSTSRRANPPVSSVSHVSSSTAPARSPGRSRTLTKPGGSGNEYGNKDQRRREGSPKHAADTQHTSSRHHGSPPQPPDIRQQSPVISYYESTKAFELPTAPAGECYIVEAPPGGCILQLRGEPSSSGHEELVEVPYDPNEIFDVPKLGPGQVAYVQLAGGAKLRV